jgi:hypothetical protein
MTDQVVSTFGSTDKGTWAPTWPCDRALLVERAVLGGVLGGHHIIAEVAPDPVHPGARRVHPAAVPHHHVGVEPQRRVDEHLVVHGAQHGGEPAALARVRQQVHHVMVPHQLLQPRHVPAATTPVSQAHKPRASAQKEAGP